MMLFSLHMRRQNVSQSFSLPRNYRRTKRSHSADRVWYSASHFPLKAPSRNESSITRQLSWIARRSTRYIFLHDLYNFSCVQCSPKRRARDQALCKAHFPLNQNLGKAHVHLGSIDQTLRTAAKLKVDSEIHQYDQNLSNLTLQKTPPQLVSQRRPVERGLRGPSRCTRRR